MADQVIIEFIADTKGLQPAVDTLEGIGGIDKALADEFRKNNTAIQDRIKLLDQTGKSADNLAKDFKKVSDSVKVEGGKKQLEDLGKGLEEGVVKSQRLTTQLRALKQQLSVMEEAGQGGSKAFIKMSIEAAKLEDQIGDTSKRIRALASDTKNIDAVVGVVSGLASAFSVAQGAAALLGGENEDLQKALLKVQAAMAIANGLQQLQNTLQKENIVVITARNAYLAVSTAVTGLFTGATSLATIATAAWNAVLNLNPIVAISTAITLAVGAIYQFVRGTDTAAEKTAEMNKQLKEEKKAIEDVNKAWEENNKRNDEILKTSNDNILNDLEAQIKLAKIRGASLTEVFNLEKKLIEDKLTLLKASGNADTSEYNALLNDKKILTAQYYRDVEELKRKSEKDLKKIELENNVSAISGDASRIPEVITAKNVEDFKTELAVQGKEARFRIRQEEAKDQQLQDEQTQKAIFDTSVQFANQLFNFTSAINAAKQANLQDQLKHGIISEQKYNQEVAKLKRKQAFADKEQAAFNIILNTSVALTKVAAQTGILAVVLGAVIAALGAAELATVIAQPIPKFAKGTKNAPPGFKLVGEAGPELIYDGGGYPIIPNGDSEKIMSKWIPQMPHVSDATLSKMERSGLAGYGIDYAMLGKSVAKEIAKLPITETRFDENGVTKFIHNGFSKREIKSKRGNF